jgi:hypothetical protein
LTGAAGRPHPDFGKDVIMKKPLLARPGLVAALALAATAGAPAALAQEKPSAESLLEAADRSRGAAEGGLSWEIAVHSEEDGKTSEVTYQVKVKGVDALAEAVAPARHKGEMMLFNDRNLWFFKPGLKKPVSISARQKLMGQAANGDIASTQYKRDYDGTIVGEEKIDGVDTWKLDLKAKAKNVTYDGIRYWISKDRQLGVKAEFLTVSGEVFKWATFEYANKASLDGKEYPFVSKMTIINAKVASDKAVLSYREPKHENHPDSIFNVNNLVR